MKKYRGYYIDNTIFHSEEEIDSFIKEQAVNAYRTAVKVFSIRMSIEASIFCDKAADKLNKLGYTWEEIEAIEIETLRATA